MAFNYEPGFSAMGGPLPRGSSSSKLSTPAPTTKSGQDKARDLFHASKSQKGIKAAYRKTTAGMDPSTRGQRMHRALSSNQFSNHPVAKAIGRSLSIADTSRAFRSANLSSALRYAVGAPEVAPQLHKLLEGRALRQAASGGHGMFPEDTGFTSGEGG